MFANLKNKLIEEVKASPSKFQQFANAAQAAVSSSSSTTPNSSDTNTTTGTNENFFSITEEDTPQNSPLRIQKLPTTSQTSLRNARARKLSNSSMASDVSFRLPSYDAPAMYHLQSDLDETSSEFDDSASTARLDVISKDQLYDAYKKSLDRYHKYRCRYTDLAKKYKELERDSTKARSVLVETQEKALRRISELREQCTLEQQAKAHLEEALRIEMDDMDCKMQAYQTKLKLLGENPENVTAALARSQASDSDKLIDLDEHVTNGNSTKNEKQDVPAEQLTDIEKQQEQVEQLARLKKLLNERDNQIKDITSKHNEAIDVIAKLRKQEEENVLLLAQTKQAIHTELEQKESEVKQLQDKLKQFELELESAHKNENQVSDSKEQLKKLQAAKHEADAKVISAEHLLNNLKADLAAKEQQVAALETQLNTFKTDSEQKLQDLQQHNAQLNEMVQRFQQNELNLADVDAQLKHTKQECAELQDKLKEQTQKVVELEKSLVVEHESVAVLNAEKTAAEELRVNFEQQTLKIEQLQREISILKEQHASSESETIAALKAELEHVNESLNAELTTAKASLLAKEKELKANGNKLNKLKKQQEQQQSKLNEQALALEQLNNELSQRELRLQHMEQVECEKQELQTRVSDILNEITSIQSHLLEVQNSHAVLEQEKRQLETKIEQMQQQHFEHQTEGEDASDRAKRSEAKLEEIVRENTKLAERNCLLEEQSHHLEKQLAERERHQAAEDVAMVSELRLQLQTANDDLCKLQTKMQQVLDEHSRMQNAQELMDHDHRTLQDKCDAYEKEKLLAEDQLRCAQLAAEELQAAKAELEAQLSDLQQTAQVSANELEQFESVRVSLVEQLNALKEAQSNDECHKSLLEEAQQRNTHLQSELALIGTQLQSFEKYPQELDRVQQELLELREKRHELEQQLVDQAQTAQELNEQLKRQEQLAQQGQSALKALQAQVDSSSSTQSEELLSLQSTVHNLREQLEAQKTTEQAVNDKMQAANVAHAAQLETLEARWSAANADVERLHEANDALQLEVDTLKNKYTLQVDELQEALAQRDRQLEDKAEASQKLASYEQMQIENEYFNKHAKQLEQELAQAKTATQSTHGDNNDLKEKLKSLQCELYVLQEQTEQHATQLAEKDTQCTAAKTEAAQLKATLEEQTLELSRQSQHSSFVTEKSDAVQKELLQSQTELAQLKEASSRQDEQLRAENTRNAETIQTLNKDIEELKAELAASTQRIEELVQQPKQEAPLAAAAEAKSNTVGDADNLRSINEQLQRELEELKYKSNGEQTNLQQEIDELQVNNKQMAERIMQLEQLRAGLQAQQLIASLAPPEVQRALKAEAEAAALDDKALLEIKLKDIMNEVQDVTNRNLFLEQKCENYLILEQSNERLKLQNAKLSRQLDETLVSMQHSDTVPVNTEFEYLRNIMFQYLTGNTNNETLVKVIAAVLKFSPQQQQVALEKEHQRRSLLNKIL